MLQECASEMLKIIYVLMLKRKKNLLISTLACMTVREIHGLLVIQRMVSE